MNPTISIFGDFQNGKSTLVNCILGQEIAAVGGKGLSVTKNNIRYTYGTNRRYSIHKSDGSHYIPTHETDVLVLDSTDEIVLTISNKILQNWDLVDTPGFNANENESKAAEYMIRHSDFAILLIHNKGLSKVEKEIAYKLSSQNVPFVVLINCYNDIFEQWSPSNKNNQSIADSVRSELSFPGSSFFHQFGENGVFTANLIWYWIACDFDYAASSSNKSILKCVKMLRNFWEYFSQSTFSSREIARISNFHGLTNWLKDPFFCRYLTARSIFNTAFFSMGGIIEEYLSINDHFLDKRITSIQSEYTETSKLFIAKLGKEIRVRERNKDSNSLKLNNPTSFLGRLFNSIITSVYDAPIKAKQRKIENEIKHTKEIVDFLETLKCK